MINLGVGVGVLKNQKVGQIVKNMPYMEKNWDSHTDSKKLFGWKVNLLGTGHVWKTCGTRDGVRVGTAAFRSWKINSRWA